MLKFSQNYDSSFLFSIENCLSEIGIPKTSEDSSVALILIISEQGLMQSSS